MKTPVFKWAVALGLQLIFAVSSAFSQIADPVVTTSGGGTQQTVTVTITESTSGVTLHYTTDRSNPTTASPSLASGASILVSQNTTLNVQAFQDATTTSSLVTTRYSYNGAVSAGNAHSLILKNDGTVFSMGSNAYGQLGVGGTTNSTVPVQIMVSSTVPLTGIVSVAAGADQSFAVDSSGRVWAWGYDVGGELGDGTMTNATRPIQITGVSGIVAIASAGHHTLALASDGTVWAWGANSLGQNGLGSTSTVTPLPVQITGLSGIVAIAVGQNHSTALTSTSQLVAWGDNSYGQLGTGDYVSHASPTVVASSLTGIVSISAGALDSYALTSSALYAWGDNSLGELANGTTTSSPTPVQVSGATGIAAIGNQTALATSGLYVTWGDNTAGRLGSGSVASYSTLATTLSPLGSISGSTGPWWTLLILSVAFLLMVNRTQRKTQES